MDDSSENEDIIFVPMTAPNAEQEKSVPPNASNDVVFEMSRISGRHRKKCDYNAMDKGLDCRGETGARRKFLPNLASSLSVASSSGDPTSGSHPTPSSSVSASLNSTFLPSVASSSASGVPISGANPILNTGHPLSSVSNLISSPSAASSSDAITNVNVSIKTICHHKDLIPLTFL